jgi:hypothetical protein
LLLRCKSTPFAFPKTQGLGQHGSGRGLLFNHSEHQNVMAVTDTLFNLWQDNERQWEGKREGGT